MPTKISSLKDCIYNGEFFCLSDEDSIKLFHYTFADELEHLKHASATVESGSTISVRLASDSRTPSQLIYGTDYAEVNRTLVGMLALRWVMNNDYSMFIFNQPPAIKLSPQSFEQLRVLLTESLPSHLDIYTLLVAMVINDLGKDPALAKLLSACLEQPLAVGENHDRVVYSAAQANIIPCLNKLPSEQKNLLMLGLEFGACLNIAQFVQAENVPACLSASLVMRNNPQAFAIKFAEVLLDVAGAAGHVDSHGAKALSEPVFTGFMTAHCALTDIISGDCTFRSGYDQILIKRATMLNSSLSISIPSQRALLRILTMGRADTPDIAEIFSRAFASLPTDIHTFLVNGLSVDGTSDGTAIIPYYIPAIFAEGLKNAKSSGNEEQAVAAVMRFLARVYGDTKPRLGITGKVVERNVCFAKEIVQSFAFQRDPEVLDKITLPWKNEEF